MNLSKNKKETMDEIDIEKKIKKTLICNEYFLEFIRVFVEEIAEENDPIYIKLTCDNDGEGDAYCYIATKCNKYFNFRKQEKRVDISNVFSYYDPQVSRKNLYPIIDNYKDLDYLNNDSLVYRLSNESEICKIKTSNLNFIRAVPHMTDEMNPIMVDAKDRLKNKFYKFFQIDKDTNPKIIYQPTREIYNYWKNEIENNVKNKRPLTKAKLILSRLYCDIVSQQLDV